eukprot:COSAG01_NODE_938_length_12628_cov_8.320137_3_plen_452_part_00
MAQEMLEVAGLLGRASKANGHYRRDPAQQQCGRPVYVQVVAGSGPGGSSSRSISTEAAARVVYDDGVRAEEQPAWTVEVPNDPGKAYAYAECDAPTPLDAVANWMVWFCPFTTSIEDGRDLWYPATDFEDFYVGTPTLPDASLVHTETQRASAASGLLDSLGAELGGLEDRVRFLDDPPRQKTMLQLHGAVTQLGAELDRLDVAGMSGEASLRGRRGALQRRVFGLLGTLETRSAAATQTLPPRAETPPRAESSAAAGDAADVADAVRRLGLGRRLGRGRTNQAGSGPGEDGNSAHDSDDPGLEAALEASRVHARELLIGLYRRYGVMHHPNIEKLLRQWERKPGGWPLLIAKVQAKYGDDSVAVGAGSGSDEELAAALAASVATAEAEQAALASARHGGALTSRCDGGFEPSGLLGHWHVTGVPMRDARPAAYLSHGASTPPRPAAKVKT